MSSKCWFDNDSSTAIFYAQNDGILTRSRWRECPYQGSLLTATPLQKQQHRDSFNNDAVCHKVALPLSSLADGCRGVAGVSYMSARLDGAVGKKALATMGGVPDGDR
jgi:hypothetical protein